MQYFTFLYIFHVVIFIFNVLIIYISINKIIYIKIDNHIPEFENNIDYSNFSTDIKVIALYPNYYEINHSNWKAFNITNSNHNKYEQSKSNDTKEFERFKLNEYLGQINIAKSHGIYGFAIYYCFFCETILINSFLHIFLKYKFIDFQLMLILKFESSCKELFENKNENKIKSFEGQFFKNVMKYMRDSRYIRINQKAVLGIYEQNIIPNLKENIEYLRLKAKKKGIGELFIIAFIHENLINHFAKLNLFDGFYVLFSLNDLHHLIINKKKTYIYTEILYKFNSLKERDLNLFQFNGNILSDNPENNESIIFDYYSPDQYYMINKLIIEWTVKKNKSNMRYIFINSMNEWNRHLIFEPDIKFGYTLLNSLSKALFNRSNERNYSFINFNKKTKIAIQAHIYYEHLISDIIEKTNNIPVNFDLYISTDTAIKKDYINKYILDKSKANNYEINIINNKGRDVLPLLIQLKKHIKKYKYICHIHTKKSFHIDFGEEWRNYLYNNLLGNKNIVLEILTEFEINDKLGMIFPEIYYKVYIAYGKNILGANLKDMESILSRIRPYLKLSINNLDFPMGNMFWANVKSIYQIFNLNLIEEIPDENGQIDGTLMHAIERIWIYLVKFNGFYYKKIFKHL